ncbi:allophanate hydrolase [Carbonactinospora thermoautotrophica]|uniref:5-oxoprolinase subunit C family protein n=1 Tax=Carbonactinospora thermoautotrophica TaxID=1469144 RepID=UPI0022711DB3|nr:biotin-dependent carboxyltransferase family protein [Carbonactinospora thermoautotrophica]MCX9190779.1 allophanate hydrolase [Carbonactinospora thermoautotrophica]
MLTVLDPGPLTTVQDGGRIGYAHLGVSPSGALDLPALALANRLVANPENAAGLETTLGGVTLRAERHLTLAVTGATADVWIGDRAVGRNAPLHLAPGEILRVGPATAGVRNYIAVRGGIDVPPVLGSRSTDLLSGLGPPPLRAGDRLPVGTAVTGWPCVDLAPCQECADGPVRLRLRLGPAEDWLTPDAITTLTSVPFTLTPASNRVAARLDGPVLAWKRDQQPLSEGLVTGSVQVPPAGHPLVFLADHPTTGGYPHVGVVHPDDLPTLAQARPGAIVQFQLSG